MEFKTQIFGYNRKQVDEHLFRSDIIFATFKKDIEYLKEQNEILKKENLRLKTKNAKLTGEAQSQKLEVSGEMKINPHEEQKIGPER